MAHEIETHGAQAAAVFARTDPWHRLGTTVAGQAFSAEDAMRRPRRPITTRSGHVAPPGGRPPGGRGDDRGGAQ